MANQYDGFRDLAKRLISTKGTGIPIYRLSASFDPVSGNNTNYTKQSFEINGVILPASKGTVEAFDIRLVDGLTISNLRFVIMAAKDATFVPGPTDIFYFENKYWKALGCTPLDPDGTGAIIYKAGLQEANLTALQIVAINGS